MSSGTGRWCDGRLFVRVRWLALLALLRCAASEYDGKKTVDVVLSYFNEAEACVANTTQAISEELAGFTLRFFVYGKGTSSPSFVTHQLPNEGREGATYLHHISASPVHAGLGLQPCWAGKLECTASLLTLPRLRS